jgi:cell wall-associated NlpC family hydrolase
MTLATSIRTPMLAAVVLTLALLVSPTDSVTVWAKGGAKVASHASKKVTKDKSNKNAKSSKRSRRSHRSYTVRGNPDITRQVATALLAQKLPELAALVGIEASPDDSSVIATSGTSSPASQSVASKAISLTSADIYQDSELDDNEDPDGITADDMNNLQELPTDINTFYKEFTKYMASLNGESTITDNGVDKVAVMETLMDWVGTRYLFGGMGRNGIDCSAFTGTIYRALNFRLPRTAAAQWDVGLPVEKEDLQFGDLVFFHTRQAVYVSHVGMYLGNHMFAHASSRNGVTVSSLDADYYSTHMIGARRYDLNAAMNTASVDGVSSSAVAHN